LTFELSSTLITLVELFYVPSTSSTSSTQSSVQIYIPNDMVGAVIGKAGSKINSIRQQSGCRITIAEPDAAGGERLVTIMGSADANQMALYLLYSSMEAVRQGQQA
jgi:heterogeneous nuclear rnp K-like protein 2